MSRKPPRRNNSIIRRRDSDRERPMIVVREGEREWPGSGSSKAPMVGVVVAAVCGRRGEDQR